MSTPRPAVVNNDINESLQKLDAMVVEIFKYTTRPVTGRPGPPELLTPDKKRARELGMEMERYSAAVKDGRITDKDIIAKINQQIEEANQLINKMQALEAAAHQQGPAVTFNRPTVAAPATKQLYNVDKHRIIMEYNALITELTEIRVKSPESTEGKSAFMALKNLRAIAQGTNDNNQSRQEQAFRTLEGEVAAARSILNLGGSKPVISRTASAEPANVKAAQNRAARLAEMQKNNSSTATMPPPKDLFSNPPPPKQPAVKAPEPPYDKMPPPPLPASTTPPPPPVRSNLLADLMKNLREKEIQLAGALPDQSKRAKNAPPLLLLPNQNKAMTVLKQISEISNRNIENLTANEQKEILKRVNELITSADAAIQTLPAKSATPPSLVNVQIHRAMLTATPAVNTETRQPDKVGILKASDKLQDNLNDRIELAKDEGKEDIQASAEKALRELQAAHKNAEAGNIGELANKIDEINQRLDTERHQRAVAALPSKILSAGAEAKPTNQAANIPEQNMPKKNDHFSKPPAPASAVNKPVAEPVKNTFDTSWMKSPAGETLNKLAQEVAFLISTLAASSKNPDIIKVANGIVVESSPEVRKQLINKLLETFPDNQKKLLGKCFDWQKQIEGMITETKNQKNPQPEKMNQLMQEMRTTFSENINKKNNSEQNRLMTRAIAGLNNIQGTPKQPEKPKNIVDKIVDRVFSRKP